MVEHQKTKNVRNSNLVMAVVVFNDSKIILDLFYACFLQRWFALLTNLGRGLYVIFGTFVRGLMRGNLLKMAE